MHEKAMKKVEEKKYLEGLIRKYKFGGVLFICISKEKPVLVFKTYRAPLRREEKIKYPAPEGLAPYVEKVVTNFFSYYDGDFFDNNMPSVIRKFYKDKFIHMIELQKDFSEDPKAKTLSDGRLRIPYSEFRVRLSNEPYDPDSLPKGCFEIKLAPVLDRSLWSKEVKSKEEKQKYEYARKVFAQYGFIDDRRGRYPRNDLERKQRNHFIVELYKEIVRKTKKRKPLPINSIYRKLTDYDVSFATIRRVLKKAGY